MDALNALDGGKTYREVSAEYGIPTTTLHSKARGASSMDARKGPDTVLSNFEEKKIVSWVLKNGKAGSPVTKNLLKDSVKMLLDETGRKSPFTNNRPGRKWLTAFLTRNPELSFRTAQNLSSTRALVGEAEVRDWFTKVKTYLGSQQLLHIDGNRVFNLDESAFFLCPKGEKVLVGRGSKNAYKICDGNDKESITVLYSGSVAGSMPPPMILFWQQDVPRHIRKRIPLGWSFGSTESGWMTHESFLEYVQNVFYPWLVMNRIEFPVILYVDGHSSHISLALSEFCAEKKIVVITLFPNSTHFLQPCDVALFHPLKAAWKKAADSWRTRFVRLTKADFASVLKEATDSLDFANIMKNGFRACGLHPFAPDAVDYNILNKAKKSRAKKGAIQGSVDQTMKDLSIQKHLDFFERGLPEHVLSQFRAGSSIEVKLQGLYEYWVQLKSKCGK